MNNNNTDITAVTEFRRFVNTYIYPETAHLLIEKIKEYCRANEISYEPLPQATIKFHTDILATDNLSYYTVQIHTLLKSIFSDHFTDPAVSNLVKSKIHTEIQNEELKKTLRIALAEVRAGNPRYLGLLFNITILNGHNTYVYL